MTVAEKVYEIHKATDVAQDILNGLAEKYPGIVFVITDNKLGMVLDINTLKEEKCKA